MHNPARSERVPDEIWNEVCDIIQETGMKTIHMEKKCKKAKWLSGVALQIAVKKKRSMIQLSSKRKSLVYCCEWGLSDLGEG